MFSCGNWTDKKLDEKIVIVVEPADTTDLKWVEGVFEHASGDNIYREIWLKKSTMEFTGESYYLNKSDTLFATKMSLQKNNGILKMVYNANGQNEGKDVEFSLSSYHNNTFVFENPFRDFPSVMQYKFIGDSIIDIKQRGFENNQEKVREYTITKVKKNLLF